MSVLDDLLAKKDPEIRTVEFVLDRALAERFGDAERARDDARRKAERRPEDSEAASVADDAQHDYAKLAEEVRSSMVRFTFSSIAPQAFDELKSQHRPKESERTEAKRLSGQPPEWSASFMPALVAAACTEVTGPAGTQPGLSADEAERLFAAENFNAAERAELFNAALSAYLTRTRVDLPKAG